MHIGILRTDSVRPEWVPTYGEYPDMFERLLLAEDDDNWFSEYSKNENLKPSLQIHNGLLLSEEVAESLSLSLSKLV